MNFVLFKYLNLLKRPITHCITRKILPNLINRQIHSNNNFRIPKTPDLIYVPHVIRWLKTKFRFKYLQKTWDPDFSEGAFIYGSTQAVCKITEIINNGRQEELEGLLTATAKNKLSDDISVRLTKTQKDIIRIKPKDIKILIPIEVKFNTEKEKKQCTVALRTLALKWYEQSKNLYRLVLVALETEFTRDYNEYSNQEWTISKFDVLECGILVDSSSSSSAAK